MRTWWIVKSIIGLTIVEWVPNGWKCSTGPYFSYKEAMAVLHHWSK